MVNFVAIDRSKIPTIVDEPKISIPRSNESMSLGMQTDLFSVRVSSRDSL